MVAYIPLGIEPSPPRVIGTRLYVLRSGAQGIRVPLSLSPNFQVSFFFHRWLDVFGARFLAQKVQFFDAIIVL